jgi:hypothetical protein
MLQVLGSTSLSLPLYVFNLSMASKKYVLVSFTMVLQERKICLLFSNGAAREAGDFYHFRHSAFFK